MCERRYPGKIDPTTLATRAFISNEFAFMANVEIKFCANLVKEWQQSREDWMSS